MKKWNEPKLLELNLNDTKSGYCEGSLEGLPPDWRAICSKNIGKNQNAYKNTDGTHVCDYWENYQCKYPGEGS